MHRGMGKHGFGRPGGWQQADLPPADDAAAWISGRLPEGWYVEVPDITVDREEILIVGSVPDPEVAEGATEAERSAAELGRIARFREDTRDDRIRIALETEHRYGRKVSWAAQSGNT